MTLLTAVCTRPAMPGSQASPASRTCKEPSSITRQSSWSTPRTALLLCSKLQNPGKVPIDAWPNSGRRFPGSESSQSALKQKIPSLHGRASVRVCIHPHKGACGTPYGTFPMYFPPQGVALWNVPPGIFMHPWLESTSV